MERSPMLTCKQLTELVTDYLEGRMPFSQRVRFYLHVSMCSHCRAYLRQMKVTIKTLGELPAEPVPEAVRTALLAQFREAHPEDTRPRASRTLGVLSALENVGSKGGWAIVGLILAGALAVLAAGVSQSGTSPLGEGTRCLLMELSAGGMGLALVSAMVWRKRSRLSASTWTMVGMASALLGFMMLEMACPTTHVAVHVFLFHVGGLIAAGALGWTASRLQSG